jgi:hypothetical protein
MFDGIVIPDAISNFTADTTEPEDVDEDSDN